MLGIHDITKNAYGNCSTTIQIRLLPNGDFAMIDIVESSESDKFDDIAFLSILHTNLRDEFNDIPEEKQSELRQFNIVFKYDGVR